MAEIDTVQVVVHGEDRGRGNLLGVQPWVTTADYASVDTLYARLSGYLERARDEGWLNRRTVVVFPEYVGTWLVIAGEGRAVQKARRLKTAMAVLALRHLGRFVPALLSASEEDPIAAGLFRLRAEAMAQAYQAVFSRLARTCGVTVVAGSTVLPEPEVRDGIVTAGEGPLYGVSAVFDPEGRAYPDLVRKAFPIGDELPFMTPAGPDLIPGFDTPIGRLGVLICADAWYPASYERLRELEVELVAVPSYIPTKGAWEQPWRGYDGASAPDDVESRDVGTLTEAQAWRRYALAGRLEASGARAGINIFLAGELWDMGGEGGSLMMRAGSEPVQAESGRAALLNLWL
ncbi:MAG: nitrilase-related carbon-nitrogen hydrolase [Anaerolineae bacterium]